MPFSGSASRSSGKTFFCGQLKYVDPLDISLARLPMTKKSRLKSGSKPVCGVTYSNALPTNQQEAG